MLQVNVSNREGIISAIKEEIVGPKMDFSSRTLLDDKITKSDLQNEYTNFYYLDNSIEEEVFRSVMGTPDKKYAAGLLYPIENQTVYQNGEVNEEDETQQQDDDLSEFVEQNDKINLDLNNSDDVDEEMNANLASVDQRQSSLGLTFALNPDTKMIHVEFEAGVYQDKIINKEIQGTNKWWFRHTLRAVMDINLSEFTGVMEEPLHFTVEADNVKYQAKIYVRQRLTVTKNARIITISISNVTGGKGSITGKILFQPVIQVSLEGGSFRAYPKSYEVNAEITEEDKRFEMLYSNDKNYAFGHGTSVNWQEIDGKVSEINTTFIPEYETYTITPEVELPNGDKLIIKHVDLINATTFDDYRRIFEPLLDGYGAWLKKQKEDFNSNNASYIEAYTNVAKSNFTYIEESLDRMESGLALLKDEKVRQAYKLANLAMLMQMTQGKNKTHGDFQDGELTFKRAEADEQLTRIYESLDFTDFNNIEVPADKVLSKYAWRGFQVAFQLMSLESFVNKNGFSREVVDLIWFPTGGGKTEAYLGAAAFQMFYRRLLDKNDAGVDVMMRYTLRLLTADQFQRASRLMVSMEFIRRYSGGNLGNEAYSIGMWVGGNTSPNKIANAFSIFSEANKDPRKDNPFLVQSCPWCGAEIKKYGEGSRKKLHGIKASKLSFKMYCPNTVCDFNDELPIYFIDEIIYEKRPTFIVGTIDKYVQTTWNPNVRYLFGINDEGEREVTPPQLIIQDELHLISGPLGTLSGHYEALIDELATDYRDNVPVRPKIIAATATIKDYQRQVSAIFARKESRMFPPSGIDINDSFFSTVKKDEFGVPLPGRKYIGFYTTTEGKLMAQVQAYSAILQKANSLPEEQRDPFWTVLSFFNNLRDLGAAINLTQMDVKSYMQKTLQNDYGNVPRYIKQPMELTSRRNSNEIASALDEMKVPYHAGAEKQDAQDVVLASNIIEVGVDVDRLSLMTIVGQPKTTAQYIQVSGRIGRKPDERPGLVVTIYSNRNARDKSHFEHFNEYHQKLYGEVESSSATPYSQMAIRRGLNAVIIGFIRQSFNKKASGEEISPSYLEEILPEVKKFANRLIQRAEYVDDNEIEFLKKKINQLLTHLERMSNTMPWNTDENKGAEGVIYRIGNADSADKYPNAIGIINSMRNVDAGSKLEIMDVAEYLHPNEEEEDFL